MARRNRGDGVYLRGKVWWLDCRIRGVRYQERLGKGISRTVAKELATDFRAKVLRGEAGILVKKKDITFKKAKELFLQWVEANKKPLTVRFYRQCLERLEDHFGNKRLGDIHAFHIEKFKQARKADGAPVRANRELQTLKALFNRCIEWGKFAGENPVRGVKRFQETRGRLRFLSEEEEQRLLDASDEPLRTMLLLGTQAGLRIQAEVLSLRWSSIDLDHARLHVEEAYAKNHETRMVPMNRVVRDALSAHRARSGSAEPVDHVFINRRGRPFRSIRTIFETARKRAGLGPDVTIHTTRHTFASRLVSLGVDLRSVMELGGWKSLRMVERYAHLSPHHLADAVELLAGPVKRADVDDKFLTFSLQPKSRIH